MTRIRARFWLKLTVYLLPFALAFLALTGALVYVGESMPLEWVARLQMQDPNVLYRPFYGKRDLQFKRIAVNMRQPEIMAIGSSRILQFRAGFFDRNPAAFYNAAAPGWRLTRITELLFSLDKAALPDVLIIAIDQPWFNDAYYTDPFDPQPSDFETILSIDRTFLQDVIDGHSPLVRSGIGLSDYVSRTEPGGSGGVALGIRAIRDGHGFRSDGSEQYGDFLVAHWLGQEQDREKHLKLMRAGEDIYITGDTVYETSLAQLDRILGFAVHNDITVIGYLPPFAPGLWQEMVARGNHTYMTALVPRLQDVFAVHNFAFFDFSDGASIGVRDDEFFDGWHASELTNLRLYMLMVAALPDVLGKYSDYSALAQIAASATDTWDVFSMDNRVP